MEVNSVMVLSVDVFYPTLRGRGRGTSAEVEHINYTSQIVPPNYLVVSTHLTDDEDVSAGVVFVACVMSLSQPSGAGGEGQAEARATQSSNEYPEHQSHEHCTRGMEEKGEEVEEPDRHEDDEEEGREKWEVEKVEYFGLLAVLMSSSVMSSL